MEKLIREAKKYIRLVEKATPGPWEPDIDYDDEIPVVHGIFSVHRDAYGSKMAVLHSVVYDYPLKVKDEDLALILAAPEMGRLLAKIVEVLEKFQNGTGQRFDASESSLNFDTSTSFDREPNERILELFKTFDETLDGLAEKLEAKKEKTRKDKYAILLLKTIKDNLKLLTEMWSDTATQ